MRTLINGTLTVQAYDANVWTQERNILRIKDTGATAVIIGTTPTSIGKIALYTLDENSEVVVDMSDYIRTHESTYNLFVTTDSGAPYTSVRVDYNKVGLINPANVLIPRTISGQPIEPPSVMYAQIFDGLANAIRMELCASEHAIFYTIRGVEVGAYELEPWHPTTAQHERMTHALFFTDEDKNTKFLVKQPEACKQYANVRWVSFTGQTRLHVWEVVQSKTETDGEFELLTQDGAFNVVKGRKDGFSLRLDGLNAYDVWYYSDVCHSSLVEVSLDGQTWQRVNVTSKGVTVQDGNAGKTNTLLVELIYKKYDAISM